MTKKILWNKNLRNVYDADQQYWEMITHDDGVDARGGITALTTGEMGSGKSTMLLQTAQATKHAPRGMDIKMATKMGKLIPETVVWRGRGLDHWSAMIPERFKKSFPNSNPKPLRVFVHCDSDYRFYEESNDQIHYFDVDVVYYLTTKDVYDNLVTGGINVIYEPSHYELPPEIVNELLADQLKELFPVSECPSKPAPPPVWWFEFIRTLIENKKRYEFFSIFIDEAHDVIPSTSRGEHWHLINRFGTQTVTELRKSNISFYPVTHNLNMIDYRVTQRMNYFVWFMGSVPKSDYSIIKKHTVGKLHRGQVFIEHAKISFGKLAFGRIPKQSPLVQVEGMRRIY